MRIFLKIIKVIIIIFLILLIAYNIYNIINIKVYKNNLSTVNGYAVLEVVSGSMEPTIKVGDLIIIDTKVKKYKKNDIVTFYDTTGSFVTHRIVSIKKNNTMITKGDANDTEDAASNMNMIVGKYVKKIPFLGMLLASFKNPVLLAAIMVIGILFCYFISMDDKSKEDLENTTEIKLK